MKIVSTIRPFVKSFFADRKNTGLVRKEAVTSSMGRLTRKMRNKRFRSRVFIRFPVPPIDPAEQLPVAGFSPSYPLERFALEKNLRSAKRRVKETRISNIRELATRVANPRHRGVFRPALSRVQAPGFVWAKKNFFFNASHERWEKGTSELCMRNK